MKTSYQCPRLRTFQRNEHLALPGLLLLLAAFPEAVSAAELLVPTQYPTIQEAVDAASTGDTIRIAAGAYYEQALVRGKTLSIIGDPGAVLHAHSEMNSLPWGKVAILGFERARVVVSNLVLEGNRLGGQYGGRLFEGISSQSSSASLENCTFRGFRGASTGGSMRAVDIGNPLRQGIIDASVSNCAFADNYYSLVLWGIDNDASLLTRFLVLSNSFTGLGAGAPFQNAGLWVAPGAGGSVSGNTFTEHIYNEVMSHGLGAGSMDGLFDQRGSFLLLRPVVYSGNVFTNNSVHFAAFSANDFRITNNVFAATAPDSSEAAVLLSGRNIVIADNNFAGRGGEAIWLSGRDDKVFNVPMGIARDTTLSGNWFSNFRSRVRTGELVTYEETGTDMCCFAPRFQRLDLGDNGRMRAQVRAWHDAPVILESSPDLKLWTPLGTNIPALPVLELEFPNAQSQEFFRASARMLP